MPEPARTRSWSWLRWPAALAVLALLIVPNLNQVREVIAAGVLWRWLIAAAILRTSAMLLASVRWELLLRGQGIDLSLLRVVRLFATGYVCNFLLPGTVGGDVARAGLVAADSPQRRMRGAATVPLDRLLGLLMFIAVGAIAGLSQWSIIPDGLPKTAVMLLAGISTAGVLGLIAMLLLRFPIRNKVPASLDQRSPIDPAPLPPPEGATRRRRLGHELLYGLALLRESKRSVLLALVFAAVGHSCLSLTMYCCLRAYPAADVPAGLVSHLWIVPSAEVPAAVLPLPGGVGAREGALSLLYGTLAPDAEHVEPYRKIGLIVAASYSAVSIVLALVVAAVLTLTGGLPNFRSDQSDDGEYSSG